MALHRRIIVGTVVLSLTACAAVCTRTVVMAQTPKTAADYEKDLPGMLEAYRHVEAASVSDAIEQTLHEKHYMSHKMQAIFPTKFVGTALTVLLKKEENHDPDALGGMLKAIDTGGADRCM